MRLIACVSGNAGELERMAATRPAPAKLTQDESPNPSDCVRLSAAARYLDCSQGTLENWISARKFTRADGLRKVGGLTRIHLPTLKARFADGTLMAKGEAKR